MIQKILRYFKGYVRIRIEGYSPERFLNICRNQNIMIWNLLYSECAYELCISLKGYYKIRPIARKTNTKIRIVEKKGLPFLIFHYKNRKIFFVGIVLAVCLIKVYSIHIWDIHIEGNRTLSEMEIVRFLKEKQVHPLMLRSEVDCESIEREIRQAYDEVVWVSAALDGSRLVISLKENDDSISKEKNDDRVPTNIIALESGKITKMITRKGTPLVHPGDEVKKGDVLVAGNVAVYNDEKEIIGYQYEHADADICADVSLKYQDQMNAEYVCKKYVDKEKRTIPYVTFGKYSFMIGSIKYNNSQNEVYRFERQLKVGDNFYLPVFYGVYEVKPYENVTKQYSKKECQSALTEKFQLFCEELKKKGIQIRGNSVKIHWYGNRASAEGTIFVNQTIVQIQDAQILDIERNTQNESSGTSD